MFPTVHVEERLIFFLFLPNLFFVLPSLCFSSRLGFAGGLRTILVQRLLYKTGYVEAITWKKLLHSWSIGEECLAYIFEKNLGNFAKLQF